MDDYPAYRGQYCQLRNPSKTHTMVATLRREIEGAKAQTFRIPPSHLIALHGGTEPWWELWTLKWREPKPSDYKGDSCRYPSTGTLS